MSDLDGYVVMTANGLAKGNDNCRDGKPHVFKTRMDAELDAAIFSGERIMPYSDYLQIRKNIHFRDELIHSMMKLLGYRK